MDHLSVAFRPVLSESPSYLIRKGDYGKAHRAMKVLHTDDIDVAPLLVQMRLLIASEEEIFRELAYIDCFKGVILRRTAIVAFSFTIPNLFGVPFLASASYFMQVVGMSSSLSVMILIIGIVLGLLANGVGVWFVGKFGRRPLLL